MRPHIRNFLERVSRVLPCPEPIVEIGAKLVPGQEAMANLRPLFPNRQYIGCDFEAGNGVDRIENIHQMSFRDGEVGTFLLSDTLEHVLDPYQAFREVNRCVNHDRGIVVATSVMYFPIHAYPNDYWRFTPEVFRVLGKDFECNAVFYAGDRIFPHTVVLVGGFGSAFSEALIPFVKQSADLQVYATPNFEQISGQLIQHLAMRLLSSHLPPNTPQPSNTGGFLEGSFQRPGWILVRGSQVQGWVSSSDVKKIELRMNNRTIHRAESLHSRPDVEQKLNLSSGSVWGFRDQIQFLDASEQLGAVELWAKTIENKESRVAISCPGYVIPTINQQTGFILHTIDRNSGFSQTGNQS